jgi:hypothetical protein
MFGGIGLLAMSVFIGGAFLWSIRPTFFFTIVDRFDRF